MRSHLKANSLKDRFGFFLHIGLVSMVSAGAFFALGFPPVLGLTAVGMAAAVRFGLNPYVSKNFQAVLNEQKLETDSDAWDGGFDKVHKFNPKLAPKPKGLRARAEQWIGQFAAKIGLEEKPQLLLLKERPAFRQESQEGSLKNDLKHFLTKKFNKHANAFAFMHDQGNVVLSAPLIKVLNDREIRAVMAHEVGHIAAGHTSNRQLASTLSLPAKILTGLNMAVTSFSSLKNIQIILGASWIGHIVTEKYAKYRNLDQEKPNDKSEIDTFRKYFTQATLATGAITLGAPEILAAQALNLATTHALNLLEKHQSRQNEFQADRIAAEITGNPVALCMALEKIRAEHLKAEDGFNNRQSGEGVIAAVFDRVRDLNKTHPNIERRCRHVMSLDLPYYEPLVA